MAQFFSVHPDNPQKRLLREAVTILRRGGVIVYPTYSLYAMGCHLGEKSAVDRMRAIRNIDERHNLSLMCRDLGEIGSFARLDNRNFRLLRACTPGSYTFILEAQRELPRRVLHSNRKTIGVRIPDHPVALGLLEELREPLLSTSLLLPGDDRAMNDAEEIRNRLEHSVDLVIDAGSCGLEPTTVIDLTGEAPLVVRQGKGDVSAFLV